MAEQGMGPKGLVPLFPFADSSRSHPYSKKGNAMVVNELC
jgi:hypothetical protein